VKVRARPGLVRLALVVASYLAAAGLAVPGRAAAPDRLSHVRVGNTRDAFVVVRALEGAARRLEAGRCAQVLTEFRSAGGTTLAEVLARDGVTAPGHLDRLLVYSGDDHPHCRKDVLAWTAPGSRVVYVCSARFREAYATKPAHVEAVILHEMLHTLGLGENPPTSETITARVVAACGG
jgi:hypothetical protein